MFKRLVFGTGVVLVLVLGLVGIVLAQDAPPQPQAPQGNVAPPIDAPCPWGGSPRGFGDGYGMRGPHRSAGRHAPFDIAENGSLAEALDMTSAELYAALAEGQTLATLAEDRGVDMENLVEILVAPRVERIEQAVKADFLTQEQADWMLKEMREHMLAHLGSNFGMYGGDPMMGPGPHVHTRQHPHPYMYSKQRYNDPAARPLPHLELDDS